MVVHEGGVDITSTVGHSNTQNSLRISFKSNFYITLPTDSSCYYLRLGSRGTRRFNLKAPKPPRSNFTKSNIATVGIFKCYGSNCADTLITVHPRPKISYMFIFFTTLLTRGRPQALTNPKVESTPREVQALLSRLHCQICLWCSPHRLLPISGHTYIIHGLLNGTTTTVSEAFQYTPSRYRVTIRKFQLT